MEYRFITFKVAKNDNLVAVRADQIVTFAEIADGTEVIIQGKEGSVTVKETFNDILSMLTPH